MFERIGDRTDNQSAKALSVALIGAVLMAMGSPTAKATSSNLTFAGTVGTVQNGIGLSGDQSITTTMVAHAAVRFELHNPDTAAKDLTLHTFDADFRAVDDIQLSPQITLAPGQRRSIIAFVPVDSGTKRRFRICAADKTDRHCGKFIARRLP